MRDSDKAWVNWLTGSAIDHPWRMLLFIAIVTVVMMMFAHKLELRMNWTDLLPEDHPVVESYREVQDRFGEATIIVVLEGERDQMVEMAEDLVPQLQKLETLYNVQARLPEDLIRNHGFLMMKPNLLERSLRMFSDPSLIGSFRGLNDDYEREYTDSESNLKRDEVEIARSLLGLTRTLDMLKIAFVGDDQAAAAEEAADAITVGEPWMISLDRNMLLISCTPTANLSTEMDAILSTVEQVEQLAGRVGEEHPDVAVSLTGMGKIGQDEMNSIGLYTQFLTIGALVLIFLLLARNFRSWLIPLLALLPLAVGIVWTLGLLSLLYGGLNLFTAMIMIVLLGLGIDFSIHLIARFREAVCRGSDLEDALTMMLGDAGIGVITGALTTAMAFLTLMIARTRGIYEFGAASGFGVLLTLVAIFLTLPSLLVIHRRMQERQEKRREQAQRETGVPAQGKLSSSHTTDDHAFNWLGRIALAGWNKPAPFLVLTAALMLASIWAMRNIGFEYDFLELEPAGLRSVELQREIPSRFGIADHSAWLVTDTIEESRTLKEQLRRKSLVGEVISIGDYVPSSEQISDYAPRLEEFRYLILRHEPYGWIQADKEQLRHEIDRLWDNLDLMSNLAFAAGLDRIVKVIDQLTGYDSTTDATDTTAILPSFSRVLDAGVDDGIGQVIAEAWGARMASNLYGMANPSPVEISDLPPEIRKSLLPRNGAGYLLQLFPRKSLWNREEMVRFAEQTNSVHPGITGTEQLFLLMMDKTLEEGGRAARLALGVIAILVLFHFRSFIGLLALVPLATGAMFMLALMFLFGMKYNYMNLIAVPIILGIGIDDGVHALHRFRNQAGDGVSRIYDSFRFIGRAILLTSLTTMIGFGSIAFYEIRGMASFGKVLFMGVGACFLATVLVLPALLRVFSGGYEKYEPGNR